MESPSHSDWSLPVLFPLSEILQMGMLRPGTGSLTWGNRAHLSPPPPSHAPCWPCVNSRKHMGQLWACLLGAQSRLRLPCPPPGESDANNHIASALGGKNPRCQCACLISWGCVILLRRWAPECELCLACLLVTVTKETQGDWSPPLDSLARTSR